MIHAAAATARGYQMEPLLCRCAEACAARSVQSRQAPAIALRRATAPLQVRSGQNGADAVAQLQQLADGASRRLTSIILDTQPRRRQEPDRDWTLQRKYGQFIQDDRNLRRPIQRTCGSRLGEPYVAVTSIDLRPPRAEVEVLLYGAWQSTARDDSADVAPLIWREGLWQLDLFAPPIAHPSDLIFMVALIEHFDEEPCLFQSIIRDTVIKAAHNSAYLERKTRVAFFIDALNRSMDWANGGPNFTSAIEISLSADDIILLETYDSCRLVRSFYGYGGQYCLGIELKTASEIRTFMPERQEAFAWAAA